MLLALSATLIVILALSADVAWPVVKRNARRLLRRSEPAGALPNGYDPGRELRAEQRARALLRSCVDDVDWEMYAELGLLRVWGAAGGEERAYAYLIYPHEPIVCYLPATGRLLNEYCVTFPDHTRPYGSPRLPPSDDVLAKWIALTGDERLLIGAAEMHLPGRLVDPERVRRDLWRLERWDQARAAAKPRVLSGWCETQTGSLPAL
jgi:hypothetical protein